MIKWDDQLEWVQQQFPVVKPIPTDSWI